MAAPSRNLLIGLSLLTLFVLFYAGNPFGTASVSSRPSPADIVRQLCGSMPAAAASGAALAGSAGGDSQNGIRSDLTTSYSMSLRSCALAMLNHYLSNKKHYYADGGNDKLRCFIVDNIEIPTVPTTVIDVGANEGRYFSEPCRNNRPGRGTVRAAFGDAARLIMVEANPRAEPKLQRACAQYQSCHIVQAAASFEHGGQVQFNTGLSKEEAAAGKVSVIGSLNDLDKKYPKQWSSGERYTVNVTTLNRVLADEQRVRGFDNAHIPYMKTDTEGHDGFVLLGANELLPRVQFLVFECHVLMKPANMTLYETVNYLSNFGFMSFIISPTQLARLDGPFYKPEYDNELDWQNCAAFRPSHPLASQILQEFNTLPQCNTIINKFIR